MKTFKFENGDLVLNEMVEGDDEIAQSVKMILLANKGEWFLDKEFGLEYSEITNKLKPEENIRYAIREAVYQEEHIDEVEFTKLKIDHSRRTIEVEMELTKVDGDSLVVGVSI